MSRTKWRGEPNLDRARAAAERRRSGAAGTHGDRRTKRLRTRSARVAASRQDWD